MNRLLALLVITALHWMPSVAVRADDVVCTPVTAVPYVIATPGKYCLERNLAMSGTAVAAITINTSQVTLDCNDHVISRGSSSAQYGVLGNDKSLLKIRNCVLHLFPTGIALTRARVADIRENVITTTGTGILLTGHSLDVYDNTVTGLYSSSYTYPVHGISVITGYSYQNASGVRIVRNKVVNARSFGIGVQGMPWALIEGNYIHVMGNEDPRSGILLYQLWNAPMFPAYAEGVIRGNYLRGGGSGAVGIQIEAESFGLCSDNFIRGFAVAMENCTTNP